MNLNTLYYFKVLAQLQHYSQAAELLYISQPSLSHAISALEKDLGVPLFQKKGRNVELTKYGKIFSSYITRGFDEIENGEKTIRKLSRNDSGMIDFAFLYILGANFVPRLLSNFLKLETSKNISFSLKQNNSRVIVENLKKGNYDLALCTFVPNEEEILFTPVLHQDLILITAPEHPLSVKEEVCIEELISYPIIGYNSKASETQNVISNLFSTSIIKPNIIYEVEEEMSIAGLVSINYGIAIVPDLEFFTNFPIKRIPIKHDRAHREIYLAVRKNRISVPCIDTFYQFILHYTHNADAIV